MVSPFFSQSSTFSQTLDFTDVKCHLKFFTNSAFKAFYFPWFMTQLFVCVFEWRKCKKTTCSLIRLHSSCAPHVQWRLLIKFWFLFFKFNSLPQDGYIVALLPPYCVIIICLFAPCSMIHLLRVGLCHSVSNLVYV